MLKPGERALYVHLSPSDQRMLEEAKVRRAAKYRCCVENDSNLIRHLLEEEVMVLRVEQDETFVPAKPAKLRRA